MHASPELKWQIPNPIWKEICPCKSSISILTLSISCSVDFYPLARDLNLNPELLLWRALFSFRLKPYRSCKCLFRNNIWMWFTFNEWPHFLTFRSTLQRSFVLVSRFVKESSCWGIRVVDFLIRCFSSQFGSGDDVIAGTSIQRVRDWTECGHTNATHWNLTIKIFALQLQCSTTSVEKCATLFMIRCKTNWCWKWDAIIALPMLCAEYTCPTMFFFWARPRLFVWSVLDNVQGTLFAKFQWCGRVQHTNLHKRNYLASSSFDTTM